MPELAEATRAARELIANDAFDLAKLRAAMLEAGKKGCTSCLVGPKQSLNLKDTAAAKAAIAWLTTEGFGHTWEPRPAAEVRPGAEAAFDLLATWRI